MSSSNISNGPRRLRAPKKVDPPVTDVVHEPVSAASQPIDIPHTECKKRGTCDGCGQKIRKPRAVAPPTEKQLATRENFKQNVVRAKALQAAEPGLTYKDAIKRVYARE